MHFTYILLSIKDGRTYVGSTNNFVKRLLQHNAGQVKSTKYRTPFKLLLLEQFKTSSESKRRELWWKKGTGRRELKERFESLKSLL